jgi:carbonic anhydrase
MSVGTTASIAAIRSTAVLGVVAVTMACGSETEQAHDATAMEEDASHAVHWGYTADDGPDRWASLSADFALCDAGRAQSPIDLVAGAPVEPASGTLATEMTTLSLSGTAREVELVNNGHTIQVNHESGSELTVSDTPYALLQFHFHAPSEHRVDGRAYPMEMHLVHQSGDGSLAVLGVLIDEGSPNAAFESLWTTLPEESGETTHLADRDLDIDDLLPERGRSYRYEGSLTTPPCSEGVYWLVFERSIQLSADQIEAFTSIIDGNNRPVQPRNGRAMPMVDGPRRIGGLGR